MDTKPQRPVRTNHATGWLAVGTLSVRIADIIGVFPLPTGGAAIHYRAEPSLRIVEALTEEEATEVAKWLTL